MPSWSRRSFLSTVSTTPLALAPLGARLTGAGISQAAAAPASFPVHDPALVQEVVGVFIDCDADTVLLKVRQVGGAACHEGYKSCFFRRLDDSELVVVGERIFDPKKVYGPKA